MKLLVPVISAEDVVKCSTLSKNVAYYMGISLAEWNKRFGMHDDLNRMSEFRSTANTNGFDVVKHVCDAAGQNDVYVTINAGCYSCEQLDYLDEIIMHLANIGVTGIIAGDPYVVNIIKKYRLKAVASTMVGVYNAEIAAFCRDIGFDRLILPRDLTIEEIAEIVNRVPNVEYECFLMRNGCRYSDSNCLGRHSDKYGAICTYLDKSKTTFCSTKPLNFIQHEKILFNHLAFSQAYQKQACGMCAIWDVMKNGITAGKIVGRADGFDALVNDIICAEENIEISGQCYSRYDYLTQMKMPYNYDSICYRGCNCYYPEIRF